MEPGNREERCAATRKHHNYLLLRKKVAIGCPVMGLFLAAAITFTGGCSESERAPLYSHGHAQDLAVEFRDLWVKGEIDALVERCTTPFNYRGRIWEDRDKLRQNLTFQMQVLHSEVGEMNNFEVLSFRDLLEGRWPRNEKVPGEARTARIDKLGVHPDGFVVRGWAEPKRGLLLVLNTNEDFMLKVQGLH